MSKKIDLTGQEFGEWLVLKEAERDKWGGDLWFCGCSCGTERIVNGSSLRQKRSKSCGCFKIKRLKEKMSGKNNHSYKHGNSGTKDYYKKTQQKLQLEDNPRFIFYRLKDRSKSKNWLLKWSKKDFCRWYSAQPRFCCYCDRPIYRFLGRGIVSNNISIDRKDSKGPYSEENCVLCCMDCNRVKSNILTYDEMLEIGEKYIKPKWQK